MENKNNKEKLEECEGKKTTRELLNSVRVGSPLYDELWYKIKDSHWSCKEEVVKAMKGKVLAKATLNGKI